MPSIKIYICNSCVRLKLNLLLKNMNIHIILLFRSFSFSALIRMRLLGYFWFINTLVYVFEREKTHTFIEQITTKSNTHCFAANYCISNACTNLPDSMIEFSHFCMSFHAEDMASTVRLGNNFLYAYMYRFWLCVCAQSDVCVYVCMCDTNKF